MKKIVCNLPGIRCSFDVAETIDLAAAGIEDIVWQITCNISNNRGRASFNVGYRLNGGSVSKKVSLEPLESKTLSLPVPNVQIDTFIREMLTFFVQTGDEISEVDFGAEILDIGHIDTDSLFFSDMIARRIINNEDVKFFIEQENGLKEMMDSQGIISGKYRNNQEMMEVVKLIFGQMMHIQRRKDLLGIRSFLLPSETISEEIGDSYERACLFATIAEQIGLDPLLLFMPKGCLVGILTEKSSSDIGDYSVSMICKDADSKGKLISQRVNMIPIDLINEHENFFTAVDSAINMFNHNLLHLSSSDRYALVSQKRNKGIKPITI